MSLVCYVFFSYRPGACGVSDVIARLLEADVNSRVWCHETTVAGFDKVRVILEEEDPAAILKSVQLKGIVFPWVDHPVSLWEKRFLQAFCSQSVPRILWVHEFWYTPMSGYALTLRERLKTIIQKWRFKKVAKCFPQNGVATTNDVYRQLLSEAGFPAGLLANTGTIPLGTLEAGKRYVSEQFTDREMKWVVVSFGNLALKYWNWKKIALEMASEAKRHQLEAVWVILGRGLETSAEMIRQFVEENTDGLLLIYPGDLDSMVIDQWIWGADAGLSGHPAALWEKSTGLLAMTERQLITVAPRTGFPEDSVARRNPFLVKHFSEVIKTSDARVQVNPVFSAKAVVAQVVDLLDQKLESAK